MPYVKLGFADLEELPEGRDRLAKGAGCLFLALLVFILICALLAVLFVG